MSIRPSSTSCVAMRNAAPAVRLPTRVCSIQSLLVLDGELDVAQVLVVRLELAHDADQLVVRRLVDRLEIGQLHGVADARDDVLALRVLEVVAVDALVTGSRVASERDAGTRLGADVAEHHRDDVDGGAEVGRNPLLAPVKAGPIAVPRIENGVDGEVELLAGVLRELAAGVVADDALVGLDEDLEVGGIEVEVTLRAPTRLQFVEGVLEQFAVRP